jgi:transposase-like protein
MNLKFNFKSIIELINTFNTEQKCIDYLKQIRWNGNVISPYDSTSNVYKYNKNNRYKCVNSNKYFNVKTGTLFEGSNIKLQTWFLGIYLITSHKKGVSSLQLSKDLNVTQKTSWFMLHRIRECFNIKTEQLSNEVEIDETFIGGRIPNGQGGKGKSVVLGMVERSGKLISKVVPNRKTKTLLPIIKENVKENSVVNTDELLSYNSLNKDYEHSSVNHSIKEYVRGVVHTNTIEGFWSFLKRGFKGIYHYISEKHLQKYVDEFVFRYNTKEDYKEDERFNYFFGNMECRLRYKDLICC